MLPDFVLGETTAEAILSGVGYGELGAIMAIVQLIKDCLTGESQVVVTGGGSTWMHRFLPESWVFDEHLVLHGIRSVGRNLISSQS